MDFLIQPNPGEGFLGHIPFDFFSKPGGGHWKHHIFQNRQVRNKVKALKNKSKKLSSEISPFFGVHPPFNGFSFCFESGH